MSVGGISHTGSLAPHVDSAEFHFRYQDRTHRATNRPTLMQFACYSPSSWGHFVVTNISIILRPHSQGSELKAEGDTKMKPLTLCLQETSSSEGTGDIEGPVTQVESTAKMETNRYARD